MSGERGTGGRLWRRAWFRRLFCWGQCPHRHYEDAGGCGGQCVRCGKVTGCVTRAELRAYVDRLVPPQ